MTTSTVEMTEADFKANRVSFQIAFREAISCHNAPGTGNLTIFRVQVATSTPYETPHKAAEVFATELEALAKKLRELPDPKPAPRTARAVT